MLCRPANARNVSFVIFLMWQFDPFLLERGQIVTLKRLVCYQLFRVRRNLILSCLDVFCVRLVSLASPCQHFIKCESRKKCSQHSNGPAFLHHNTEGCSTRSLDQGRNRSDFKAEGLRVSTSSLALTNSSNSHRN